MWSRSCVPNLHLIASHKIKDALLGIVSSFEIIGDVGKRRSLIFASPMTLFSSVGVILNQHLLLSKVWIYFSPYLGYQLTFRKVLYLLLDPTHTSRNTFWLYLDTNLGPSRQGTWGYLLYQLNYPLRIAKFSWRRLWLGSKVGQANIFPMVVGFSSLNRCSSAYRYTGWAFLFFPKRLLTRWINFWDHFCGVVQTRNWKGLKSLGSTSLAKNLRVG